SRGRSHHWSSSKNVSLGNWLAAVFQVAQLLLELSRRTVSHLHGSIVGQIIRHPKDLAGSDSAAMKLQVGKTLQPFEETDNPVAE
ncbi:hypothetical protein K0M31_008283, partial [Melipona bicolor]